MYNLFGTDGIRNKINQYPLDIFSLHYIILAIHITLKQDDNIVLLGRDTRRSGLPIINVIKSTLQFLGAKIYDIDIITTPCASFLTKKIKADYTIMITASHNDYQYNGLKIFDYTGQKISNEQESSINRIFIELKNKSNYASFAHLFSNNIYKVSQQKYKVKYYNNHLTNIFLNKIKIDDKTKIVFDCANGAIVNFLPKIMQQFIQNIHLIHNKPDGFNINLKCGAIDTKDMVNEVLSNQATMGMSFDGDGDRFSLCLSDGTLISGDQLIAAIAIFQKNKYGKDTLIINEHSAGNLSKYLISKGLKVKIVAGVGDKNIICEMIENNYEMGGEKSGHIILPESNYNADGLVVALKILEMYTEYGKSKFITEMMSFEENSRLEHSLYNKNKNISDKIKNITEIWQKKLESNGRVFIRKSGTEENLIRITIEHYRKNNKTMLNYILKQITHELK